MPADTAAIDPARDALIAVDVQPDFMPGGALPVPGGDAVVPVVNRLLDLFAVAAFGILGYVLLKLRCEQAPLLLGAGLDQQRARLFDQRAHLGDHGPARAAAQRDRRVAGEDHLARPALDGARFFRRHA